MSIQKNRHRRDFAFQFLEHIENNGGIWSVLQQLPEDNEFRAQDLIMGVYEKCQAEGTISYRQYFSALGTLVHWEVI